MIAKSEPSHDFFIGKLPNFKRRTGSIFDQANAGS